MDNLNDLLKNWKGEKTIMTIFPHPDDETMATGGLLTYLQEEGWKTVVVSLTDGGAGKVFVDPKGLSTRELRRKELNKAAKILKVSELVIGNLEDAKLGEKVAETEAWIKDQITKFKPGIIVTYDHSGASGHPDHIVSSLIVKRLLKQMNERPRPLLLWVAFPSVVREKWVRKDVFEFASEPHLVLAVNLKAVVAKYKAINAHKSQGLGKGMNPVQKLRFFLNTKEWYHRVNLDKDYSYKFVEFKI